MSDSDKVPQELLDEGMNEMRFEEEIHPSHQMGVAGGDDTSPMCDGCLACACCTYHKLSKECSGVLHGL